MKNIQIKKIILLILPVLFVFSIGKVKAGDTYWQSVSNNGANATTCTIRYTVGINKQSYLLGEPIVFDGDFDVDCSTNGYGGTDGVARMYAKMGYDGEKQWMIDNTAHSSILGYGTKVFFRNYPGSDSIFYGGDFGGPTGLGGYLWGNYTGSLGFSVNDSGSGGSTTPSILVK